MPKAYSDQFKQQYIDVVLGKSALLVLECVGGFLCGGGLGV